MQKQFRQPTLIFIASLGLGIWADILFFDQGGIGLSFPLFIAACFGVLLWIGRGEAVKPQPYNLWLGISAVVFASFVAIRANPELMALNILVALCLILGQVAWHQGRSLHKSPAWIVISGTIVAGFELLFSPIFLLMQVWRQMGSRTPQWGRFLPVLRGMLIAAPVLLVFTGLLSAADEVFASYISDFFDVLSWLPNVDRVIGQIVLISFVTWGCLGALVVGLGNLRREQELPAEGETQRLNAALDLRFLGATEAITVLGLVDLLFAGFMAVQATYFFGGRDTLIRTGTTYAEYARRGFFELFTVATLALGLLWCLALVTRRDEPQQRRVYNGVNLAMVVLLFGMLFSAVQRMLLYEVTYGLTHLRFYTLWAMGWLGVTLLLFSFALLKDHPRVFTHGATVAALACLLAINLINPDAAIAARNIERAQRGGELDTYYLGGLSSDATPVLLAALPALTDAQVNDLRYWLAEDYERMRFERDHWTWQRWHLSDLRAWMVLEEEFRQNP